jgi:hypothetical protein
MAMNSDLQFRVNLSQHGVSHVSLHPKHAALCSVCAHIYISAVTLTPTQTLEVSICVSAHACATANAMPVAK